MTKLLAVAVLLAGTMFVPVTVAGAPTTVRLVVTFRPGTPDAVADRVVAGSGGAQVERIDELRVRVVAVPAVAAHHVRAAWARNPQVQAVETDGLLQAEWVPPDPMWAQQTEQRSVRAPKAWTMERGSFATVVAVVDTGVQRSHPDLENRLVDGWDFIHHDHLPSDDNGHGTAVAGIIAANANTIGVAGMCPRCRVMPLKALDENGMGFWTVAAKAIVWAANHRADVINLSFGGPSGGTTLGDAIAYARAKGAVVVGAAGNFGSQSRFYPAAYPGVISVAAASSNDLQYSWSNYSSDWVDIAAPGCTWTTKHGSGYGSFCGTSAATPVVSGIAALVDASHPGISRAGIEQILTGATVETPWSFTRSGRIDAYKAVYRAVHGSWPHSNPLAPTGPLYDPVKEVTFLAGNHAGYRFAGSGAILRGEALSLADSATARASARQSIPTRSGYWFYLADGPLAGYWVAESSAVFLTPAPTPTPVPSASGTPLPSPTP